MLAHQTRENLKAAIEQDRIWQAFQPIVSIRDGSVAGFEVLARWTDPLGGEFSPAEFLPLIRQHKLIGALSVAQMERACAMAARWPGEFFLAFNVCPRQLVVGNFARRVAAIASKTGFPLHRIQVEITEESLITNASRAYAVLRDLHARGVQIAIDDFGTGYSSLARLESFPFQKLKIDARFVRSLHHDAGKRRIAAAIIGLGHSLGISVVAEGIELAQEEDVLRGYGCDFGQGWLYGKAVPAEQARRCLLERGGCEVTATTLDSSPFQQLLQLDALYRQAPVGLCFVDRNFRHVRVNDRFAALHAMAPHELEGRTIFDVMDKSAADTAQRFLLAALTQDVAVQNRYHTFDGEEYQCFSSRVTDVDGTVIGFSVVSVNVPDRTGRPIMPASRFSPAASVQAKMQ